MLTIQQLLEVVAQLPAEELNTFAEEVIAPRANRNAPHLNPDEAGLLLQINRGLSLDLQARFDELIFKRQQETLTESEQIELIQLSDQVEQLEAERVVALSELTRLRGVSVSELMTSLGIPSEHAN